MIADLEVVAGKQATTKAARVLVVEDERIVARSLQKQLTTLGYEVVGSVPSGEDAVRQCGQTRPDIVLMDIRLEGAMDGVESAALIRERFRLPIVYLTAYSNNEILERAKLTEPFGYILKPFEERELHVVLETALYKHQTERRLQDREHWYVATLKCICDAVVATDNRGHITYLNHLAERLTGWASQDALGQSVEEVIRLVHKDTRQPVDCLQQAMHNCTPRVGILLIARDHSEKDIENSVSFIAGEYGTALGKVIVFRDVAERKLLEERVREAKKMEAIGQLAGGVAHALNNLMTTVLGHSQLMLDDVKPGDPFFVSAREIKRAAKRTALLTQKLLAFSRKQILQFRPVDLNAVIARMAQVMRRMQGGVQIDLSLEPSLGTTTADPEQLEEALLTLFRNGCEAMPQGGQITIETANVELPQDYTDEHPEVRAGHYVLLAVSDNGPGIGREAIGHLFEPFYTTDARVGAGLGLAAVYGLVKQCGGDIEVQSELGKGTSFRLYLPRVAKDSSEEHSVLERKRCDPCR